MSEQSSTGVVPPTGQEELGRMLDAAKAASAAWAAVSPSDRADVLDAVAEPRTITPRREEATV